MDLAGIENYTSRFGAGEWTRAKGVKKGRRKGENADSGHLKLYLGSEHYACISRLITRERLDPLLLLGTNREIIIIIIIFHYSQDFCTFILDL